MALLSLEPKVSDRPVSRPAEEVSCQAESLRAVLDKLRREMRSGEACTERGNYPALVKLNAQIEAALDALMAEWHLNE